MIVSTVETVCVNTDFPGTWCGVRKTDKNQLMSGNRLNNFRSDKNSSVF